MLTTSKGIFKNSSNTFGCYVGMLGSAKIASNKIWLQFPFLISVSFSCLLKESTYNDVPCFLRSFVGSYSVQSYQYLLTVSFQPVWHQVLRCCNKFCFGGSKEAAPHFLLSCHLHLFVGLLEFPDRLSSCECFLDSISKKPIHANPSIILIRIFWLDWVEIGIISKD